MTLWLETTSNDTKTPQPNSKIWYVDLEGKNAVLRYSLVWINLWRGEERRKRGEERRRREEKKRRDHFLVVCPHDGQVGQFEQIQSPEQRVRRERGVKDILHFS
jgi:hypothetical protein